MAPAPSSKPGSRGCHRNRISVRLGQRQFAPYSGGWHPDWTRHERRCRTGRPARPRIQPSWQSRSLGTRSPQDPPSRDACQQPAADSLCSHWPSWCHGRHPGDGPARTAGDWVVFPRPDSRSLHHLHVAARARRGIQPPDDELTPSRTYCGLLTRCAPGFTPTRTWRHAACTDCSPATNGTRACGLQRCESSFPRVQSGYARTTASHAAHGPARNRAPSASHHRRRSQVHGWPTCFHPEVRTASVLEPQRCPSQDLRERHA